MYYRAPKKRAWRKGWLVASALLMAACVTAGIVEMTARDNQQDQAFCRAAARFNQDSTMVGPTAIRIAERENQVWQIALGQHGGRLTKDEQAVVAKQAVNQNWTEIQKINAAINRMSNELMTLYDNNTGKYDYQQYQRLYRASRQLVLLVTMPDTDVRTLNPQFHHYQNQYRTAVRHFY
ncbi:hypothetical protein [Limosilactobacillus antri]|uniref:hypothetical protein n=1 Tax=Limosilactobacillus antri TaxID=227943 RepID=UPI001F595ACE|nr:hypothetical protein [Limosilactobacillus antri]